MSPMHISPVAFIGIVLIKQMIFTIVPYQTVRVVDPSVSGGEMELRTIFLLIEISSATDCIRLIDFVNPF